MGNHFGYTINGPPIEATELPIRPTKSPSVRREQKLGGNTLRSLYQHSSSPSDNVKFHSSVGDAVSSLDVPVLPLTPPMVEEEFQGSTDGAPATSEVAKTRSILTTPVNHTAPLTPDNTPPREKPIKRPFLGTQPSMASTRAESFQTAREDPTSDEGSASSSPVLRATRNYPSIRSTSHLNNGTHKPSPLANLPITNLDLTSKEASPAMQSSDFVPTSTNVVSPVKQAMAHGSQADDIQDLSPVSDGTANDNTTELHDGVNVKPDLAARSHERDIRRGRSLRERLEASQQISRSPSMDKFASIIGWSNDVRSSADLHKRLSGVSNASTVEAVLVELPRIPKKRNTLRHMSKNESLRSASSPLPTSNRTSMQSASDSAHRLIHKKVKLGNHNRLSFGSDKSRSLSLCSNAVPKVEVIKVAIIPERSSSLHPSAVSSRRHSLSTTGAPTSFRKLRSPDGSSQRKRAFTETIERSRDRYYPPQVPPRASSLSAPSSRNTSRANSVSSDPARFERRRAEKDLRTTLDRMELDRLTSSLKSESIDLTPTSMKAGDLQTDYDGGEEHNTDALVQDVIISIDPESAHVTPGGKDWADFRRPSMLHTPFSQPSFVSASPEISEAKLISLHPHNNHSVQLIEPFPLNESYAVGEARRLNQRNYQAAYAANSPLRISQQHPPATPPQFHVVPATPQQELQIQLGQEIEPDTVLSAPTTPQRPAVRPRTDSFAKNLLRNVSLKHARNRKADQELDSSLNPFWRPRPFWDGIEGVSPEKKRTHENIDRGIINNSLGLPQQKLIIPGPLALVRKISQRRRNEKLLVPQSSYSSLHRLRTGRRLYRLPGFGMQLHFMSMKEIQESIYAARQKRAEEKRERRREALRKSIGSNIVVTGDSRFPASMNDDDLRR